LNDARTSGFAASKRLHRALVVFILGPLREVLNGSESDAISVINRVYAEFIASVL
jgi:hypothetical protein